MKLLILLDNFSKETNLGYSLHLYNDLSISTVVLYVSCYSSIVKRISIVMIMF